MRRPPQVPRFVPRFPRFLSPGSQVPASPQVQVPYWKNCVAIPGDNTAGEILLGGRCVKPYVPANFFVLDSISRTIAATKDG
jgi:hypothetical protein